MSLNTRETHIGTYMNVYGGIGGEGGAGGHQGGGGGTGEGPVFHFEAHNLTNIVHLHGLEQEQQTQQITSEQSTVAQALVQCSPPSQFFQGRQKLLDKMHQYFSKDLGQRHIYVLHGLGGSGKTQIALKFLDMTNTYKAPRFTKQFLINASSKETLDTAFINIAISQRVGKTQEAALSWLISQREEWMLLFDNADDPSIDLFPFFPTCRHGNIIITSRNPQTATHGLESHSQVGNLDETNASELLLRRSLKEKTKEHLDLALEIVQGLSCLPLAIIQAGAYIQQFNCLHNYLAIYRENYLKLWKQRPTQSHDDYEWTVYTTWQISFNRLSSTAAHFLKLCSMLHHKNIPEAIFKQAFERMHHYGEHVETLREAMEFLKQLVSSSGNWYGTNLKEICAEIAGFSLIERNSGDTLTVHPLVHLWCQKIPDDEVQTRKCMIDIVGMSIELSEGERQLRCELAPHVNALVQDLETIPPLFWAQYAAIYLDSSKFKAAGYLENRRLEELRLVLGNDHSETLAAMGRLAVAYRNLGQHKDAKALECTVLEKQKQILGRDHLDTLKTMQNLAVTYRSLRQHKDAEALQCTVLEKRKQMLGDDHPDTLMTMGDLAVTCSYLGRHKDAELLQCIVLEKRRQILGQDHPDTLTTMSHLAITYRDLEQHKDAEALQHTVLKKRRQILGNNHPETLKAMSNLAAIYWRLGQHKDAEALQCTVLEKRKQILGDDHLDTLTIMINLALTYRSLGQPKDAEALQCTVLEKQKQIIGHDHPDTLKTMHNQAATYRSLRQHKDAELLQCILLEKRRQILGQDHPDTLKTMHNLAETYRSLRQHKDAAALQCTVLEKCKQILGQDHLDTLMAMSNLAATYRSQGQHKDAEALECTVLEKRKQILGQDHPHTHQEKPPGQFYTILS